MRSDYYKLAIVPHYLVEHLMLKVAICKVGLEKEQQLRDWLAELMRRKDEVRETFIQETVRHEQAYLVHTSDGPILVYAIEAEDHEKGRQAFQNSTLPIDVQHKSVMQEVLADKPRVELLYDCALE